MSSCSFKRISQKIIDCTRQHSSPKFNSSLASQIFLSRSSTFFPSSSSRGYLSSSCGYPSPRSVRSSSRGYLSPRSVRSSSSRGYLSSSRLCSVGVKNYFSRVKNYFSSSHARPAIVLFVLSQSGAFVSLALFQNSRSSLREFPPVPLIIPYHLPVYWLVSRVPLIWCFFTPNQHNISSYFRALKLSVFQNLASQPVFYLDLRFGLQEDGPLPGWGLRVEVYSNVLVIGLPGWCGDFYVGSWLWKIGSGKLLYLFYLLFCQVRIERNETKVTITLKSIINKTLLERLLGRRCIRRICQLSGLLGRLPATVWLSPLWWNHLVGVVAVWVEQMPPEQQVEGILTWPHHMVIPHGVV